MSNYQLQEVKYEGYLAEDPIMRFLPSGTAVINFRIGSTRTRKTPTGESFDETTWMKVSVFGNYAETLNTLLGKGSWVIVTGRLRVNEFGGPQTYQLKNGEWASSFEMIANDVRVLRGKPRDNKRQQQSGGGLPY